MASIVTWLIGFLFLGVGCWILLLRFEGLVDRIRPHNMSIGHMTVDGQENRGYAELLRARFDHHFRHPVAIPKETGFLEVVSLDTPELFQQKGLNGAFEKMTLDVSGVDVAKLVQFVNQLARPDEWVVEGDFQTQPDRALLALRLSRGDRLIRTWYLERRGDPGGDKATLLERLIDDAIFQMVYDFGNEAETDEDLVKWRRAVPAPASFPNRAAVAAYYEARGALGRYHAHGDWSDLDVALDRLQTLRAQMPEYADGLQLLAMALAERRNEAEAIHVYEQLRSVLLPAHEAWGKLSPQARRRILSVDLLKATATAKLYTWQSAHRAIADLLDLTAAVRSETDSATAAGESAACSELHAHTAIQLASTYALYLAYVRQYPVADMFGAADAPVELRISDPADIEVLRTGPPEDARRIVRRAMRLIAEQHRKWIEAAERERVSLEGRWASLPDGERRKAELVSRLQLAVGYASYRMAELERRDVAEVETVFGKTFDALLDEAARALRRADAAHPNHYLVLQFLGLVYSEPRRRQTDLSIAEQYFTRAIAANPSDYYGHELLAGVLLRRVANVGIDLSARATIEKGLEAARTAVLLRDASGDAHLMRAEFQTMLIELERNESRRQELRAGLQQYIDQADRFLPRPFNRPDVDLTWVRIAAATRILGEEAEGAHLSSNGRQRRFEESKQELETQIDQLITNCELLRSRWVAHQRVFHVEDLHRRALRLRAEVDRASLENWRAIQLPFV
jgi:tetratricopeptide (TPR) repeat protein